jgi:hypothetical protein
MVTSGTYVTLAACRSMRKVEADDSGDERTRTPHSEIESRPKHGTHEWTILTRRQLTDFEDHMILKLKS